VRQRCQLDPDRELSGQTDTCKPGGNDLRAQAAIELAIRQLNQANGLTQHVVGCIEPFKADATHRDTSLSQKLCVRVAQQSLVRSS